MKVLITGSKGQLGRALVSEKPEYVNSKKVELLSPSRKELDLSNHKSCKDYIKLHKPHWLINAAAYTRVDEAESQSDLAYKINGIAPEILASQIYDIDGKMIHISTDYVFDGKQSFPYRPNDKLNPLNTYGRSKAFGESGLNKVFNGTSRGFIIRTSWLVSEEGENFVKTILKMHKENKKIKVISDQVGCITNARSLAKLCWQLIKYKELKRKLSLIYHWSDEGVTNWFEVAIEIGRIAKRIGLIKDNARVDAILTADYPSPVNRPKFSLLDSHMTFKELHIKNQYWKESLLKILASYHKK